MKQVILMRDDLNMRKGKMIAQGAHASTKVIVENFSHPKVKRWLNGPFAKIVVRVGSEEELRALTDEANRRGLLTSLIVDAGRTEFNGVPTVTCGAIGPDEEDAIDPVTGHLKLL